MPNRTPLRYPGGKQRLTPFVREVLLENGLIGGHYVEPYAGGAGVAMELLLDDKVATVHLNDSDYGIYAFWKSVLDHSEEFCERILITPLTVPEWRKQQLILRSGRTESLLDTGFSAFYLNRCNRSGILTGGLIGGLRQQSEWNMDARFPREELARRVRLIGARKSAIKITNDDAEDLILKAAVSWPSNSLVYCDPPYYNKASRLYLNHYKPLDHQRLAQSIQVNLHRRWMVSYDSAPEILESYRSRRSFLYDLQYSAASSYKGREVFVFSDDLRLPDHSAITSIDYGLQSIPQRGSFEKKVQAILTS